MPGIMQASTQHMPTKPRKAASTCIDCKSKKDTSEKFNSTIRATLDRENYVSAYTSQAILFSEQNARKYIEDSATRF